MDCQRFHRCPFYGSGCEMETAETECGVLDSIKRELGKFSEKIKAVLRERQSFSYEEDWYQKIREEILRGRLIKEEDLTEIEERVVDEFIQKRKEE